MTEPVYTFTRGELVEAMKELLRARHAKAGHLMAVYGLPILEAARQDAQFVIDDLDRQAWDKLRAMAG